LRVTLYSGGITMRSTELARIPCLKVDLSYDFLFNLLVGWCSCKSVSLDVMARKDKNLRIVTVSLVCAVICGCKSKSIQLPQDLLMWQIHSVDPAQDAIAFSLHNLSTFDLQLSLPPYDFAGRLIVISNDKASIFQTKEWHNASMSTTWINPIRKLTSGESIRYDLRLSDFQSTDPVTGTSEQKSKLFGAAKTSLKDALAKTKSASIGLVFDFASIRSIWDDNGSWTKPQVSNSGWFRLSP